MLDKYNQHINNLYTLQLKPRFASQTSDLLPYKTFELYCIYINDLSFIEHYLNLAIHQISKQLSSAWILKSTKIKLEQYLKQIQIAAKQHIDFKHKALNQLKQSIRAPLQITDFYNQNYPSGYCDLFHLDAMQNGYEVNPAYKVDTINMATKRAIENLEYEERELQERQLSPLNQLNKFIHDSGFIQYWQRLPNIVKAFFKLLPTIIVSITSFILFGLAIAKFAAAIMLLITISPSIIDSIYDKYKDLNYDNLVASYSNDYFINESTNNYECLINLFNLRNLELDIIDFNQLLNLFTYLNQQNTQYYKLINQINPQITIHLQISLKH